MKQAYSGIRKQFSSSAVAIDFTRESEISQVFPSGSLLSSQPGQWNGVHLSYYQHRPHELPKTVSNQHLVLVHLEVPTWAEQRLDDQFQENQFRIGDILIVPAKMPHYARWDTAHRYLILSLDPAAFLTAVQSTESCDNAELVPHFATADPLIHGIGLALKTEVESSGLGGQLYVDSLCTTLLHHLIRHYTVQKPVLADQAGGLPNCRLRQVLEYIDAFLDRKLALADLAAIAQMSPSYFTQLFKESTGSTPHQYVIQQRLERAKHLLKRSDRTIIDIALECGFNSHSHLSKQFRKVMGMTPKTFRG